MRKAKNNPDSGSLRVLILEDNPVDAELVERELRRAKIAFTSLIVEGKRAFSKALADFQPEVILSDFKLPAFDGLDALEIARLRAPDTPFIFVSGSIGEERAIEMLALGAADYIFKDNLARLGPAVRRVIDAARLVLAKKQTDEELCRHVDELRLLAEAADRFVHINDLDEIYNYLAQTIPAISGADYLRLSLYDEKLQALRPKIVKGLEPFRETLRRRFQIDPMQMVLYLKDMRQDDFSDFISRRLLPVRDGLYGFANRKIPRSACRLIEKLLAIGSMHTMGFSWENQLYGGLTVWFKKGKELRNQAQVETLLNQATVSIKCLLAEKSLRESEERFRRISATTSDISYSCISDAEGNYALSWMTGAADSITGYTIEEILAMKCWGKLLSPEDIADFEKHVTGLAPGNSGICELRLRHKNGSIVWVQSSAECVATAGGLTLYGGLVNISGRKRIETSLRESEQKYRTLVTQSPDGIFIADLQGKFLSVNQAMCDALRYTEAEFLAMKIWDIVPEQYADLHKQRMAAILKGEAKNEAAEYLVKGKGGKIHYVAILSAPYYLNDRLIGFQGIARDISESKKMEMRLRESEQYYRTLVETSPDAIVIVDAGGRVTFASQKTLEIFGIPDPHSIKGISILDFVVPEENPRVQERMVEILSGRSLPQVKEYPLQRKDGRAFWGEVSSAPLRDEAGRSIGLLLVIRDVSERKRVEAALRESEEKYRLIAENTAETISVLDLDLKFTYVSPAIVKLRGFTVEESLIQTMQQTLTPDSLARIQEVFLEEMALEASGKGNPKRSRTLELQEYHKDGSIVWVENSMSFLRNAQGQAIGFLAVSKDISERKRAEHEQKKLLDIIEQSLNEIYLFDAATLKFEYVNQGALRNIGYTLDEMKDMTPLAIKPEYTEAAFRELLLPLIRGELDKLAITTIHRRKDGSEYPVEIHLQLFRQEDKSLFFAVINDISDRRRAEEQNRYQADLLQNVSDAIIATDQDSRIQVWNKAAERIYGWKAGETVGRSLHDILKPEYPYQSREEVVDQLEKEGSWSGEIVHHHRDGNALSFQSSIMVLKGAGGDPSGMVSVNHDISERKQAEGLIRASLKEKEVLLQEIHHRVKNNLQIISGLLTLQADHSAGMPLEEIFRESQDRIRTIALIHEKLYRSHNLAEIAFDEYLRALTENLFNSHGIAAGSITVRYDMERILFTIEKAIPLGLIVNELITNSLKHAFPAGRRGEIRIGLRGHQDTKTVTVKTDSGTLHVVPTWEMIVADNGIGLPSGQNIAKQKTLGMNLVSMLANQLQAELKVKAGPGAEFRLVFPATVDKSKAKDNPRPGGI